LIAKHFVSFWRATGKQEPLPLSGCTLVGHKYRWRYRCHPSRYTFHVKKKWSL